MFNLFNKLFQGKTKRNSLLKKEDYKLQGGEIYLYRDEKNQCYRFAKVLAAYPEDSVVFIRGYKQKFQSPPDKIDYDILSVGSMNDPEGPTIGCAPIAYKSIHNDWLKSPDYGIAKITEEEITAVSETIDMMNQE